MTAQLVQGLRATVRQADHCLNPTTYRAFTHLLDACISDPTLFSALRAQAPEWVKREFLLNIDVKGHPVTPTDDVLNDFRQRVSKHPDIKSWFQEGQIGGQPVLLVARWLCHLAGLRHRTVQLFLDHPATEGYTLLQVRGFDKIEAPGCFDMPCAGHVSGPETVEGALFKELEEELGLNRADVSAPVSLGSYEYRGDQDDPALYNVEYRAVYRSRLQPGALSRIRFVDGEVAAVALFAVADVQTTIDTVPERVASGLARSWAVCLKA